MILISTGYKYPLQNSRDQVGAFNRGQGFMTAALSLAIHFRLNHIGLNQVKAITSRQNQKAIQLPERLNFIQIADLNDGGIEYELR